MAEEEWNLKTWKKREEQRDQLRSIIFDASKAGNNEKVQAAIKLLDGELEYTYDEQPLNKDYVSALYRSKKRKSGQDTEVNPKTTKQLIENDFNFFNMAADGSLVVGGMTLLDVVNNYDEPEKADMLRRLKTYRNSDALGKGSRNFGDQAMGVGTGVGIDLIATAGAGTAAKLGKGTLDWFAEKLAPGMLPKAVTSPLVSALSPTQKVAAASAGYGGTFDTTQQNIEMQLDEEKEYDPVQGITSTAISAVAPYAAKPAGRVINKISRVAHLPQAAGWVAKKVSPEWTGGIAATKQLQEAFDAIGLRGVDMTSGSAQTAFKIKSMFQNVDNAIEGQYSNLNLNVDRNAIEKIIRDAKNKGIEIPESVNTIIKQLQSTRRRMGGYGQGQGTYIESTLRPDQALRNIKNKLWTEGQDAKRQGKSGTTDLYNIIRRELIELEESTAKKVGGEKYIEYKGLKNDVEILDKLKETDMGKKIFNIVGKNDEESQLAVQSLMNDMTSGDFALGRYTSFMKSMEKFGNIEGRTGAASSLKNEMQESFGYYLTYKKGNKFIEMLSQPDGRGMDLLKTVYPDDAKIWANLESLAEKMAKSGGKSKGMANSVIANMVTARLGSKLGGDIGDKLGSKDLGAGAGAIGGILGLNKLLNSKRFQDGMVHALDNDGRFATSTRSWLKKQGYSIKEINNLTDTLTGLPFAGFGTGNFDEIWEKNKDQMDARIEEIRQDFLF